MNLKNLKFVWLNGEFISAQDANVSVLNHSLHYGGAAFEGIRSYGGKIFALEDHILRLFHSANLLGIKVDHSIDEITKASYELLEKNDLKNAYIRPLVFKSSDSLRINLSNFKSNLMIAAWGLQDYLENGERKKHGINVGFSKFKRPSSSDYLPFSAKITGLYALNQISKNNCDECFDDVIIFDDRGFVTELTTSNLFIVKNGVLKTPIADCFLNGITRQTIIKIAHENQIECRESRITMDDLFEADEIFASGTAIEILPILSINNQKFFDIEKLIFVNKIKDLYKKKTS